MFGFSVVAAPPGAAPDRSDTGGAPCDRQRLNVHDQLQQLFFGYLALEGRHDISPVACHEPGVGVQNRLADIGVVSQDGLAVCNWMREP